MKQQFLKDKIGTIRLTVYDSNRFVVPSAATVTLYKNDGSSLIQSEASASINSDNGELTYNLTTSHTEYLGLNYKAIWKYTVSGTDYYETQLFDVVRSILSIPIIDDDLYSELPSLARQTTQKSGTATSGASSSLTDTIKLKEPDNYWKGGIIEIISGTGSGQRRDVASNTQSTGVVSVSPNWGTTPDTTSVYRIIKSYSQTIQQCFEKLEQMLYDKGKRDALILEASQIKIPLIYLCLQTICMDLSDELDDKWDRAHKFYAEQFKNSFSTLALDYDEDDSGGVQGEETQQNINTFRIGRS